MVNDIAKKGKNKKTNKHKTVKTRELHNQYSM